MNINWIIYDEASLEIVLFKFDKISPILPTCTKHYNVPFNSFVNVVKVHHHKKKKNYQYNKNG